MTRVESNKINRIPQIKRHPTPDESSSTGFMNVSISHFESFSPAANIDKTPPNITYVSMQEYRNSS